MNLKNCTTSDVHTSNRVKPKSPRRRKNHPQLWINAGAVVVLTLVRGVNAQTNLTYLQVPASGNMPGVGNDGPSVYNLPGYGNVQVSMTNVTPDPLPVTYFDQLNAYNETTNNAVENAHYGTFSWGTDTQRFDIYNGAQPAVNETYDFNFTFLSGIPNSADLYFVVDGLADNTTATVSQGGNLVGEYQFPHSAYYLGGPSSTTLYGVAGPQTFSSLGDGDPLNTGWALWQPTSPVISTATGGGGTVSFLVNQIPGDGIGFTVGYTTVPEPTTLSLLAAGVFLMGRRARREPARSDGKNAEKVN